VLPASTPAKYWEAAKKAAPGATLSREFFPERAEKRVDELRAIKEMTRAAEDAISTVTEILARAKISGGKAKIGSTWLTSEKLRQIAAVRLAEYNAACPEMIISSGKHTALPHHRGAGVIREGTVVVDIFPRSHISHYWSDCTRTYVVGKPPKTFAERYHAVLQVQREAIRRARPGITKLSAWSAKRFRDLGFETDIRKGTGYIHTLGHGVGLEIHEAPRLNEPLRAGNVIAIEPGLYYDYGIRVEDIGAITKTSFRNFVKLAKDPYI
jgi:Xaa-Pro aminopeptidase